MSQHRAWSKYYLDCTSNVLRTLQPQRNRHSLAWRQPTELPTPNHLKHINMFSAIWNSIIWQTCKKRRFQSYILLESVIFIRENILIWDIKSNYFFQDRIMWKGWDKPHRTFWESVKSRDEGKGNIVAIIYRDITFFWKVISQNLIYEVKRQGVVSKLFQRIKDSWRLKTGY